MAICKDCLHFEICSPYTAPNESYPEVEGGCRCFKDKNKFKEVVKCKECKHRYEPVNCSLWYATLNGKEYFREHGGEFSCSFGEKEALKNGDPIPATGSGEI